jgi:serine phosphatase RsbU (regulator of sigma subunit)/PAS domain-containing protein
MDERLMDAAPVGMGAFDRAGRWLRANPALAALNGVSVADLLGRTPSEVHGERGHAVEELVARVHDTGVVQRLTMTGTLPGEESERCFDLTFYPADGAVGILAIDDTARRQAQHELSEAHRRAALMARAGHLLSTALSVQETADFVATLCVPEIADWCFVELLREDGRIDRVAMRHRDASKHRWMQELDRRFPLDPSSSVGSPAVIRTGEPELIEDLPDEWLVAAAQSPEHLEILREIGFGSACVVPLIARGRTLGDIALATDRASGRRLTKETLPLARALADRCAVALDNAMAYHQRDVVALSLQEELLPRDLPPIPGLDVAARYAASGQGNDVGGDFYDVFASEDGWQIVIGDVVGKGPVAAAVTGLARHTLRAAAAYERSPTALLTQLNRALLAEEPGRRLASVACLRLVPGDGSVDVTVGVAGHPLPLLVRADGSVRELGVHGRLLGVDEVPLLEDVSAQLVPGDLLVLYTDGVIDARGDWGFFGEERLHALLADCAMDAPSRVVQRIESAVLAASGGRLRDDLAIVALRLRAPRSG